MKRALVLLLLTAQPSLSSAQSVTGDRDILALQVDGIFAAFDRTDAPGCAVGVYRDGRILYARGYGMADVEAGVPLTPRTVFDIGSVAKMFTAAAVVLLAQDGKLSLEDPVSRYFPEMAAYANSITVRQLLNHTAGLHEYYRVMRLAGVAVASAGTRDFLRFITRSAETNFLPGVRPEYSNSAYVLAGELVSRVSGRSLAVFLQERVFGPLGMRDTRLLDDHTHIIPGRARGYALSGTAFRLRESQQDQSGDDGVWATVEDFGRWDRNWGSGTVGGVALAESLVVPGKLRDGSTIPYALGGSVEMYRGLRVYSKDGNDLGFLATYNRYLDLRLSVACFCNREDADTDLLARQVAAVYLGTQMASPLPSVTPAWETALLAAPERSVPAEQLARIDGVWRSAERIRVTRVSVVGDQIVSPRLVPLGLSRFRVGAAEWVFDLDTTPQLLTIRTRGGTVMLQRVEAAEVTVAQLEEYAGDYANDETDAIYTLAVDAEYQPPGAATTGGMTIRIDGRVLGTLEPRWRDGFVLVNSPASGSQFDFSRDEQGRIIALTIQSQGVQNLRFLRRR